MSSTGILKSADFLQKRNLTVRFDAANDIIRGIQLFCNGSDSVLYSQIVNELTDNDVDEEVFIDWLNTLKENINELSQQCESLVFLILKRGWPKKGEELSPVYKSFVVNLLSAHTYFLRLVLGLLVDRFVPEVKQPVRDPSYQVVPVVVSTTVNAEDEECFKNVHKMLKAILEIVPLAPVSLLPLFSDKFPYMKRESYTQVCFIHNLLHVTSYLPTFRRAILEVIIDRMMKLDVHSSKKDILEAEMEREEQDDLEMEMELDEVPKTVSESDAKRSDERGMAHELANTLDILMVVMFDYIKEVCHAEGELDWEATKKLYRELLFVFDKLVLPTHAIGHVQFLLFYISRLRQPLAEGFVDYLWKKVLDPNMPSVLRQSAVSYIGSLLARGTFVPISMVTSCFEIMCSWIHRYIDSQEGNIRSYPDVALHGHFLATCQAVFYVFAFRHKDLAEMPKGFRYLESLNFNRIVSCCLNPLKFCPPAIMRNFAAVARNYQLAYCYTIIERNNRQMLPTISNRPQSAHFENNSLECFFPFDPYILLRSKKYIKDSYREYTDFIEAEEDNEAENDDDNFLEDISLNSIGTSPSTIPEFLLYGSSPGFKHATNYG